MVNVGRRFARARRTVVPEKAFSSSKGGSRKGAACDRDVVYVYRSAAAFPLPSTVTYRAIKGGRVAYRFAAGTTGTAFRVDHLVIALPSDERRQ